MHLDHAVADFVRFVAATGVVTALPFPHRIIAGDAGNDPFMFLSGPSILSAEDLIADVKEDGNLFISVPTSSNNSFEQPLEVVLR